MKLRPFPGPFLALILAVAGALPASAFEALLIHSDGTARRAYLVTSTSTSIRYRDEKDSPEVKDSRRDEFTTIHIVPPPAYLAARDLYQDRRYEEARTAFAALKEELGPLSSLPDNPATLSAFYEMECLRRLGDLQGLAEALKRFNKDPLVRENHLRQIELYLFWDAVRTKNWNRIDSLVKDRAKQRLPGYQRAQVSYCHALSLDARGRASEALDAYNAVLVADAGSSAELARQSALAILRIHLADPEVKAALEQPGSTHLRLAEARAVAKLFELSLGAGEALPGEYHVFLPP